MNSATGDIVAEISKEVKRYEAIVEREMRRVSQSRARLILRRRFFGALASVLECHPGMVGTACTDGRATWWDPRFTAKLTNDELDAVWAHEVLHCVLNHFARIRGRDGKLWNIAGDYAINLLLRDEGGENKFTLPSTALIDDRFLNMPTEAIYEQLVSEGALDEPQNQPGPGKGDEPSPDGMSGPNPDHATRGMGGVIYPKDVQTRSQEAQLEQTWRSTLASAAHAARVQGQLSAGMDRLIKQILDPPMPWEAILQDFIDRTVKSEYSWKTPNRRHLSRGIILPAMIPDYVGPLALIMDTSGSVGDEELAKYNREINGIMEQVRPTEVRVYYVDSKLCHHETFEPGDEIVLHPQGGGGTSFRPAFERMEEEGFEPVAAIYFTDLYSNLYPDEPDFPVLWAHYGVTPEEAERHTPPFGQMVAIL